MTSLWKNWVSCIRGQKDEDEVPESGKRFPVLKLPQIVMGEFIKHLEPTELLKFSFTSKRTHEICKSHIWRCRTSWIEYRYPTELRLSFDGTQYITYNFHHTSDIKEGDVFMEQSVSKNANWSIDNRIGPEWFNKKRLKGYNVFSEDPVDMVYTWALYFKTLYTFNNNRLYVKPTNTVDRAKRFLKMFIGIHGRKVFNLAVEVDLNGDYRPRLHLAGSAVLDFQVQSVVTYDLGSRYIYKAFNASFENLQTALNLKYRYVDLRSSTITDEEMNMFIKEWNVDLIDDYEFDTISIRRNYAEKQVDFDVLLGGLVYERLEDNQARDYHRAIDNLAVDKHHGFGGFDVFREDGDILSIYFEYDRPIDGVVYFSPLNPNWHTIHFVSWLPEDMR